MDYICQHCKANLDGGDIYEYFYLQYNDHVKALQSAKSYGWSETNKVHFNRAIIVQPDKGVQYLICPECNKKSPLKIFSINKLMLTSENLQSLTAEDYDRLYKECIINAESEHIIGKVLYEQLHNKSHILKYELLHILPEYRKPIIVKLKQLLDVSSIYIEKNTLFIDWSLPSPNS